MRYDISYWLTFEAISRHPVEADVLALLPDGRIGHIVIADSVDALVVTGVEALVEPGPVAVLEGRRAVAHTMHSGEQSVEQQH